MEVRYMLDDGPEVIVTGVDFLNLYPFNKTVMIRYIKDNKPGEALVDTKHLTYLKVYKE